MEDNIPESFIDKAVPKTCYYCKYSTKNVYVNDTDSAPIKKCEKFGFVLPGVHRARLNRCGCGEFELAEGAADDLGY